MLKNLTYTPGSQLEADDLAWYNKINARYGLHTDGQTLVKKTKMSDGWPHATTLIIFTGTHTPFGYVRDCGDHYIEALYSSYRWISKDLTTIIEDVEDA